MTLPNGADGLGSNIALAFPLTVDSTDPDQSLANRSTFDQPTVEEMLKQDVKASQGWNGANDAAYGGLLRDGVPLVTNIIFTVVDQIWDMTPLGFLPFQPSDVLDFIAGLPILGDIIPGLDASKITSGTFGLDMISGLLDIGGNILDSLIPGLDASKIISGIFGGGLIPGLDASKITSGTFPTSMISGLLDVGGKIVTSLLSVPTSVITGLFGGGGTILDGLIPGLDTSKITSGTFPTSMISGLLDVGGKIVTSLLSVPTSVITGLFGGGGTILDGLIPGLDASKVTSGTFGTGLIPGLDVSKIISGVFGSGFIPGLDASKITSGTFPTSMISGLLDAGGKIVTSLLSVPTSVITGLFGGGGTILDSLIPGLDASKIISGTFGNSMVPGLGTLAANIFNAWYNTNTAAGTPEEVTQAVESIRVAVKEGYTLQTFTANGSFAAPSGGWSSLSELYLGCIGGGGKGATGQTSKNAGAVNGGAGGSSGGLKVNKIDPATIVNSSLTVTIGVAASSAGANGTTTKFADGASTLCESVINTGGIYSMTGYVSSTSAPGAGGAGGTAQSGAGGNGTAGDSSAVAAGGTAGTGTFSAGAGTGGSGGSSGNGQTSTTPISGGGGGGGGGGRSSWSGGVAGDATGGTGGSGGYPGGGSGGGGAAYTSGSVSYTATGGAPGNAGNGFGYALYK